MDPSLLIGLDFGGGGARCLLLDPANGRVTCASRPCDSQGAPGTGGLGVDLDLESLWSALAGATREALLRADASPDAVAAVAATSMRFGTVVLDEAGAPLLAVPNRDARAALEGLQLAAEHGEALYQRSGQWPVPVCAAPRLRWLATNRPDDWKRAASVLAISDWITWRLCGERVTEPSQAGCTLLLDLESRDWAADWLDRLELRPEILPRIGRPTEPAGTLGADAAEALGLRAGPPVVIGGGDSQCGLLGAGAVAPGQRAAITGTTAPVQLVLGKPLLDPEARLWTGHHVAGDRFVLESNAGPMGDAVSWLARVLHPDSARPEARLLAEARDGEPGAAGLFSTLGAEVMNGREMGLPIGHLALTHMTTPGDPHPRRHLVRAVVEGLAYGVRANLEQIEEVAGARGDAGRLKLGGGMARSDTWCQVLADVLGTELEVAAHVESSALGVALCAGVGAGVFESLEEAVQRCASPSRTVSPDPERAAAYQERYAQWCQLRGEQARA
ncbi:MAG: FGGY-family carbohydrate kinase, partial [Proteobacteria bacterium]|nr:FGGY-family carbohydrate kinase [Pseudomonadota bacterium]